MKKRAILINQVTGPLFIDIANAYCKKYQEVILFTGTVEETYSKLNKTIKVIYKTKYNRNKSINRLVTWSFFYIQAYFYILFKKNIGHILLVTNPPMLPFLGGSLSKIKSFTFDVLIYDVYPDALANFGYINKKSAIFKIWDKQNTKAFLKANRVFTISQVMKTIVSRTSPIDKVEVIYPWVDTSFIKPISKDKNWFIHKHGLTGKRIVLYSGNMGATHDLMTILLAAEKMKNETTNYHFLFIGDGVQKEQLVAYAKKKELTNVTFLPFQSADVLPYSFTSATFGVVSLGTGAEGLSVPSKTYYMLAAGAAIIAITEKGSEIEYLVANNNVGKVFSPKDENGLIEFFNSVNNNSIEVMSQNARVLSQKFTKENAKEFI